MFVFTPQREQKTHRSHESLTSLYSTYFWVLLGKSAVPCQPTCWREKRQPTHKKNQPTNQPTKKPKPRRRKQTKKEAGVSSEGEAPALSMALS